LVVRFLVKIGDVIVTAQKSFILVLALCLLSMAAYAQGRDVTKYPGSDIGQQINNAYTSLPPTGGKLHVPAKHDGSCYQYSTPILINIPDKSVVIEGDSLQSTCLQYLGTGIAIRLDFGFSPAIFGTALRDLSLQGTAQQGTGMVLGGSNGAEGALVENVRITGFALGVTYSQRAWASRFVHAMIDDNVQNLYYPPGLAPSGENIEFDHTVFLNTNTVSLNTDANVANSIVIDAGGPNAGSPPDFNFVDCSFDGVQLVLRPSYINIVNPHFEGGFGRNSLDWIVIDGAYVNIVNPMFLQDFASGTQPSQLIRATAGLTVLLGVKAYSQQVIPRFMLLQGTASALVLGEINVQNFAADIVKDAGATGYFSVNGSYGLNYPLLLSNNTTLAWQNNDGAPTEAFRLDAYNNLVVHNPGASISFWNTEESSVIAGINDSGLNIGPATISTSGDAHFNSVTAPNSAQPATANLVSQTQVPNSVPVANNSGVKFSGVIRFGSIPTNTCKEDDILGARANTDTFLVPIWPTLESGLTGMMYTVEPGKVRVRLCNITTHSVDVAAHQFEGRFIH
jgi:hypothetical protein